MAAVRAREDQRVVIAAGHLQEDEDGVPVVVGHLIDLTDVRHDAVARAMDPTVADFNEHRAVIEQAEGVLVQIYSVDAEPAFALLRAFSRDANLKVRDVATLSTSAAADVTPPEWRGRRCTTCWRRCRWALRSAQTTTGRRVSGTGLDVRSGSFAP